MARPYWSTSREPWCRHSLPATSSSWRICRPTRSLACVRPSRRPAPSSSTSRRNRRTSIRSSWPSLSSKPSSARPPLGPFQACGRLSHMPSMTFSPMNASATSHTQVVTWTRLNRLCFRNAVAIPVVSRCRQRHPRRCPRSPTGPSRLRQNRNSQGVGA